MEILFTRGESVFSKLICDITQESVSHVAIRTGSLVIHSNLRGVNIESFKSFSENCVIVKRLINPEIRYNDEFEVLINRASKREHSMYDIGAILFIGLSLLLRRFFKMKLPKSNLWNTTGMFICTELVTDIIDEKADSMITPYGLYEKMVANGWKELT